MRLRKKVSLLFYFILFLCFFSCFCVHEGTWCCPHKQVSGSCDAVTLHWTRRRSVTTVTAVRGENPSGHVTVEYRPPSVSLNSDKLSASPFGSERHGCRSSPGNKLPAAQTPWPISIDVTVVLRVLPRNVALLHLHQMWTSVLVLLVP